MIQLVHAPAELRRLCDEARARGERVGLVPTMGALHRGHLSLIEEAVRRGADHVVVTIFVNPLQFGPRDDFDRYPRTLDDDVARCREAGVATVFAPERDAMYPSGFQTHVEVEQVTTMLEGASRPGHFRGVTTVVAKLFHLAGPCVAVFGRKDYQQWKVIERMARDLDMPVEVVGAPIVREPDGLALSSRNRYLSPDERERARAISAALRAAAHGFEEGERDPRALMAAAEAELTPVDRVEYVALADADALTPLDTAPIPPRALLAIAAHVGRTRLIDNLVLGEDRIAPSRAMVDATKR